MAIQDFSPQGIQSRILAQGTPLFRQGAQAISQAATGAGQRRGIFGAADIGRVATEGLGPALGQVALRAGETGERMAADFERQKRALEQQLTLSREEMAQRKQLEEQRLAEMVKSRQLQAQLQLFPQLGFTSPLLESAGLAGEDIGLLGGDFEDVQRQLGRLGLPGQPFGTGGRFGGAGPRLDAATNLQLARMFPGMSRGGRLQQAMNLGLISGPIQPGQFQR